MAKRWKRRQEALELSEELDNESKMIEHTIAPHSIQGYTYTPPNTGKITWGIGVYKDYLDKAQERGYKIGARVETQYGAVATITGIKNQGSTMELWGNKTVPDCFLITTDQNKPTQNAVGYNENELKLLGE